MSGFTFVASYPSTQTASPPPPRTQNPTRSTVEMLQSGSSRNRVLLLIVSVSLSSPLLVRSNTEAVVRAVNRSQIQQLRLFCYMYHASLKPSNRIGRPRGHTQPNRLRNTEQLNDAKESRYHPHKRPSKTRRNIIFSDFRQKEKPPSKNTLSKYIKQQHVT